MTIKVQCGCGTRYSFEVEPQGGVMPFKVNCPACNADGTEAANQIIAQSAQVEPKPQARLRMQAVAAPAPPPAAREPADLPPPAPKPAVSASMRKIQAEAKQLRRLGWMIALFFVIVAGSLGAWGWYRFVGSKPRLAYTMKLPGGETGWRSQFLEGGKILLAAADRVILHDIHTRRDVWSAPLPGPAAAGAPPLVYVDKQNVWVCRGDEVARLDRKTGEVRQTVPIAGQLAGFTPTAASLLVVSATGETRRVAMTIDLASCEVSSREIEVPRAEKHAMPDELPPNVQPTAGVLLSQAMEEQKFNKPLDAVSSEFFSAGQNLVELRVKLLEPKVTWVKSIKPRGPSLINGNTTAGTSVSGVEEEVANDIKRDKTGGVKGMDESLYEVRLRRWLGEKPVEWKGRVTGLPAFFALPTVDLVVAGKSLTVFDKQNNKLFEAKLSYPISERFGGENPGHLIPAAEQGGVLYFFDQGVLTALSLPGGQVQWRLTSVGISAVQFDGDGALYVDSTAASPEDIQYSDQIKFEKAQSLILKVEARTGKILWQAQNLGQHCFLTGKYLYTMSGEKGGGMLAGLAEALNSPQPEAAVYFHIYRLDPANGAVLWKFFRDEAPNEAAFQENWFLLRSGNEMQAWNFLDY